MTDNTLIHLDNISLYRQHEIILENIQLKIEKNQIVTLVGPNGAGKSSLIKIALNLIRPDQGKVITQPDLSIGYVPQSIDIDRNLPVSVLRFLKLSGSYDNQEISHHLSWVGADQLISKSLFEISGGELKRVLLARALLKKPQLLILDEPTSGVDISGQSSLYKLIRQIRNDFKCGVLLVSHNLHIVMAATDKVICLNRHLCCSGTPQDVQQHPEFVSLFGQQNAAVLSIYQHHHDHVHDLHGDVCNHG